MKPKIFKTKNPIIGALHFKTLLGYKEFTNIPDVLSTALKDLREFEKGGVDAIIVENNYDFPHKVKVDSETVAIMTYLTRQIVKNTKLPVGINVLWNDFESSLSIAKVCGLKFIRVAVFVDSVETAEDEIVIADSKKVIDYRKKLRAEDVLLFTDIQVKHARMLKERPIKESVDDAIRNGSDGIIITGRWTADAPNLDELKDARDAAGDFPIIIGSGADKDNIKDLLKYADCVIVSTSLKEGDEVDGVVNVKLVDQRISSDKVKEFMIEVKNEKRS